MRLLLALLLVPAFLLAQDEKPGEKPGGKPGEKQEKKPKRKQAGDLDIPDPGTPIEDAATARQEVSLFEKGMRKAESDKRRIELLQRLGNYDHPDGTTYDIRNSTAGWTDNITAINYTTNTITTGSSRTSADGDCLLYNATYRGAVDYTP